MNINYEVFEVGEEEAVNSLISRVFDKYIGKGYPQEGQDNFKHFISPDNIRERFKNGTDFILLAKDNSEIIGVISIRNNDHISTLFVDERYHKRGIASELLKRSLELIHVKEKGIEKITVNSSPYAVEIYKKMGFKATDSQKLKDGIIFVPMVCKLD